MQKSTFIYKKHLAYTQNYISIYTKVRSSSAETHFHLSKVPFGISEQNLITQKAPIAVL